MKNCFSGTLKVCENIFGPHRQLLSKRIVRPCCTFDSPPESFLGLRVCKEQEEQHGGGLQRDLGKTHPLRHDRVHADSDGDQDQEDQVDVGEGNGEGSGWCRRGLTWSDFILAESGDDLRNDHGGDGERVGGDVRPAAVKALLRSDVETHSYQNVV